MALTAAVPLELPVDGRQSETALAVARGTARLLHAYGRCVVSELPLPSGRRADLVALDPGGEIWIVEIKSSIADFRADQKWQDYRAHCDRLFFATTVEVPCEIFPPEWSMSARWSLRRAHSISSPPRSSSRSNSVLPQMRSSKTWIRR